MSSVRQRTRAPRGNPEQALQRACAEVLARYVPKPPEGPAFTSINPVPAKSKAVAGVSKAMGLRAGWPDMHLLHQSRSIFIEFKADKGRVSPAQAAIHSEIEAVGGVVEIVRSLDEFLAVLAKHSIPCKVNSVIAR